MVELTGRWRVVGPTTAGSRPSLTFEGDGQVFGSLGVNRFRSTWSLDDDVLELGPLASTLMAGPPEALAAEQTLHHMLSSRLHLAQTSDGTLSLRTDDGAELRLAPAGPQPTTV